MKKTLTLLLLLLFATLSQAQVDKQASSIEIYDALLKLNNTATVMFVAAHPDDENTRLISWLSNHKHVNTVYLSLTRGDGGQNLIGTEKGPLLGLLRTQELLQARSIDGGQQFFSRANDFGYSKTATETRAIWEEEEIMSDVVWAIRKFRPDVLVNRFDHNSNGKTHGHHTFSAIASLEAFDRSGDESEFSSQLSLVETWQPKRVFFNTSWWFYGSRENFEEADKSKMVSIDIGEYYPMRGISNNEIAAQSRSMHKCQGFGSHATRGSQIEYLEFIKGDKPEMENGQMTDILSGIDMSWNRVPGGDLIDNALNEIIVSFNHVRPSESISNLIELRNTMSEMNFDQTLKSRKLGELDEIIKWCAAIYFEATTASGTAARGDSIDIDIECVNRADQKIVIERIKINKSTAELVSNETLAFNDAFRVSKKIRIPTNMPLTTPYWLEQKQDNIGMYKVADQSLIGLPETPVKLNAEFLVSINGHKLTFIEPITYKYADPAIGEFYEPFVVAPPVSINFGEPVYLLVNDLSQEINVEVRTEANNLEGKVQVEIGPGWKIEPSYHDFSIEQKGDRQNFTFKITPPTEEVVTTISAKAVINDTEYNQSYETVKYGHIPQQTVFVPAESIIEHLKIKIPAMRIGYITGAGDDVPRSLRQLGIIVDEMDISKNSLPDLNQYKAVVIGIRAFNTQSAMTYLSDDLWKYAENGGTVIVQYNTAHRLKTDVSPLPLTLGRDRITEEDAKLSMLSADHMAFNFPNKISSTDFDNWVQERGLYFASEWDDAFTPLLRGHDTGEDDKSGMLLVAAYGKGHYVYTGISFFRQLPAGVPGAYRLFVNLLALQNNEKP